MVVDPHGVGQEMNNIGQEQSERHVWWLRVGRPRVAPVIVCSSAACAEGY